MATNIPPHNLGEVIDACIALIDNPGALGIDDLNGIIPGPDFPTGGIILGRAGIRAAYHLGRGSIVMRGKVEIETLRGDREAIIVTEIPYQVNKAAMVERIAELVREKKIEGISALRDESDRDGYRVVVELKRDAMPDVVLNQLYRFTPLQSTFGANIVALDGGRPLVMNLKDLHRAFVAFREEVISRRTKYLLNKARDRAHVLVGLAIAVANIDEVIRLIRASKDANEAREQLMARDWPAKDVAAMITLIDDPRHKVSAEGTYAAFRRAGQGDPRPAPAAPHRARPRRDQGRARQARRRDRRLSRHPALARAHPDDRQGRAGRREGGVRHAAPHRHPRPGRRDGGRGPDPARGHGRHRLARGLRQARAALDLSGAAARRQGPRRHADARGGFRLTRLFVASTHTPVLFFSSHGRVYKEKVWRLPQAAPQARGKALINILPMEQGERITTIMPLPEDEKTWAELDVMFATTRGTVRRNKLSDFVDVRRSGIIAMKLDEGEAIVDVQICTESDDVLLTAGGGQCIRFPVTDVRVFQGRTSMGVRGIALAEGDKVISLSILRHLDATADERAAYLKRASAVRRGENGDGEEAAVDAEEARMPDGAIELGEKRYVEMSAAEQFVLTLSERGFGKRTSSYEYRTTGRGGKGIVAMAVTAKTGRVVASFPVEEADQIMLVTDGGQLIRCPVDGIRIAGRSTQGVIVFNTAEGERVVSVERLSEEGEENGG